MKFFVTQEFDDDLQKDLRKFYSEVDEVSKQKDAAIEVIINSEGGDCSVLKSYLDAFEYAKSEGVTVKTHVSGIAASCGSLLAIAGSPGHRSMSAHSEHYMHLGSAGFRTHTDLELERMTGQVQRHFDFVRGMYAKYAKVPNLRKKLETDHLFVDAETAKQWKLVDTVR